MALESFYGGKQGVSPVIKAKFNTRDELGNAFSDPSYKDVWFSELAIIDSPNKLHKDNGKLYRRTLSVVTLKDGDPDYAGPHAEYIGQIVGPAGGIPNITLTTLSDLQNKAIRGDNSGIELEDQVSFPIKVENDESKEWIQSNEIIPDSSDFYIAEKSATELNQIPGKIDDDNYNDSIRYSWFQVLKPNSESSTDNQISYVYLGFEIPYPVFEFSTTTTDYINASDIKEQNNSKEHPYYWNYNITIPRGIRGIWQEVNLGKIGDFYNPSDGTWGKYNFSTNTWTPSNIRIYHSVDSLTYKYEEDRYNLEDNAPTASVDFNGKGLDTQFWYLTVKCPKLGALNEKTYDVSIDTFYFYLEDFKVLSNVTFDDTNGNITLLYNNGESKTLEGMYSYLSDLSIESDTKAFVVNFKGKQPNLNDEYYATKFIKDPETGLIYIKDEENKRAYLNVIKDIYTDYQNNIFYILFSSTYFENQIGTLPDDPQSGQTITDSSNRIWTYDPANSGSARWWYTISPIYETKRGVRILTTLNLLDGYDEGSLNVEDVNSDDILAALNSNGTNWPDGINPYEGGRNGRGTNSYMNGEFGVYKGYVFYYDKLNNTWATIGSWDDSATAEHQAYIEIDNVTDDAKSQDYSVGMQLTTLSSPQNIAWPNLNI